MLGLVGILLVVEFRSAARNVRFVESSEGAFVVS
jgi:hypothetical protein